MSRHADRTRSAIKTAPLSSRPKKGVRKTSSARATARASIRILTAMVLYASMPPPVSHRRAARRRQRASRARSQSRASVRPSCALVRDRAISPVGVSQAQAHQGLSILEHLDLSFCHGPSGQNARESSRSLKVLVPERGWSSGAFTPTIWWLHYADDEMAPIRRRFTLANGIAHVSDMSPRISPLVECAKSVTKKTRLWLGELAPPRPSSIESPTPVWRKSI